MALSVLFLSLRHKRIENHQELAEKISTLNDANKGNYIFFRESQRPITLELGHVDYKTRLVKQKY